MFFLKPVEIIAAPTHSQEIERTRGKLRRLVPVLISRKNPTPLHDNARLHVAAIILQKLNELGYETLPHPPYTPDLSPIDFHCFFFFSIQTISRRINRLKTKLKRKSFYSKFHRLQGSGFSHCWDKQACNLSAVQVASKRNGRRFD